MTTKTKSSSKKAVKVRDLKPKKDAKGGNAPSRTEGRVVYGKDLNHNETLLRD
jgi:hypothetical protein